MDTFIDILTLCHMCILSNFLDARTYNFPDLDYGLPATHNHLLQRRRHDYNALSPDDRNYFSYIRGLAMNLISWLGCHYGCKDPNNKSISIASISRRLLHRQVRTILQYKITAEADNIKGIPNCTSRDLRNQIKLLFTDAPPDLGEIDLTNLEKETSLEYTPDFRVVMWVTPNPFEGVYCVV